MESGIPPSTVVLLDAEKGDANAPEHRVTGPQGAPAQDHRAIFHVEEQVALEEWRVRALARGRRNLSFTYPPGLRILAISETALSIFDVLAIP